MHAASKVHTAVATELVKGSRFNVNLQKQVIRTYTPNAILYEQKIDYKTCSFTHALIYKVRYLVYLLVNVFRSTL